MKLSILSLLIVFISHMLNAQSDELAKKQDSIQNAGKEQMKAYREARALFESNYSRDPQHAVDSANRAQTKMRLAKGLKRLSEYEKNLRIDTLKEIDLTAAGLTEVPEFVFEAAALEVLILDRNAIKKLPKELDDLQNLKRIYWQANNLEQFIRIRIQPIKGLEKLDISNNSLTRLPTGIKRLAGLKELVLDENFFNEIPIKRLKKAVFIETLSLNKSHSIELNAGNYDDLAFLEVLKVNDSKIRIIHPDFYKLSGLKELQLQENQIDSLPLGISKMKKLTKLSFYKNDLKALPLDLFHLNLKIIDLYYNDLEVIPPEIGNLKDLEILFLAHNKIYELPESLGSLSKLDELYLHNNRLSVLPASLGELSKVQIVRVNDNYLSEFPNQFLGRSKLEYLDIANNQISTIPIGLSSLPSLSLFTYQENPIDFNTSVNRHLSPMIVEMIDRGVNCIPRVYKEVIE